MLFSVVIPTFNRAVLLARTIASVEQQAFRDFEVIVVDDGSTDGTSEYLASLGDRVRVIRQPQQGAGAARNAGVAAAAGEYVAFLDSDDLWFPWTLATFARVIDDAAPSIIVGGVLHFSDEAAVDQAVAAPLEMDVFADYLASASWPVAGGTCCTVYRRAELLASNGFTHLPVNLEDHDLNLRLGEAPRLAWVRGPVTVAWRQHTGSLTTSLLRGVAGVELLIAQERAGRYPGGATRARQRREIITRHARPIVFACLRDGQLRAAARLYSAMFRWHVQAHRWTFLGGLPLAWTWSALRGTGLRRAR